MFWPFVCTKNFLLDQTQRLYSGHNIPLTHRTDHSQWKCHFGNCIKMGWPKIWQGQPNQQLWLSIDFKLLYWIFLPCRHKIALSNLQKDFILSIYPVLEINHLDFFFKYNSQTPVIICIQINFISSVWSNCIDTVRALQSVILNIKSETQALFFYRECAIFASIILNRQYYMCALSWSAYFF